MRHLALILLTLMPVPDAFAADLQGALSETNSADLPVAGKLMALARDGLAIAADDGDAGLVMLLDPLTLQVRARAGLDAPVLALAARDDRDGLAVLTGRDGLVTLHRLDAGLRRQGMVSLGRLDQPGLSLTADGRSVVAARAGDLSFAVFDAAGRPDDDMRKTYEAAQPLAGAWVADDVAYFNAAAEMRISAANLDSGISYSEYQIYYKDGRSLQPFSVAPLLADRQCRAGYETEFLLAHADPGLITLLRADAERTILRQVAESAVDTREPSRDRGAVRIASSCNGAAVWLAGAGSSTLSQFSVVREGDRLEQVGTAPLPGPAAALALNWDGESGWVLLRDRPMVIRFELSRGEPPPLPGNDAVRELQRLLSERGYPVGAVDGVIGDRTRRAATLIGRSIDRRLDLRTEQGLNEAIKTISELPASRY